MSETTNNWYDEYATLYGAYSAFKHLLIESVNNADQHYGVVCDVMTSRVNESKVSYSDFDIVEEAVETKNILKSMYDVLDSFESQFKKLL